MWGDLHAVEELIEGFEMFAYRPIVAITTPASHSKIGEKITLTTVRCWRAVGLHRQLLRR
jgi:hypothetical protein